jgi:hypothetical protein
MDSTLATVVIPADAQAAAQADMPDSFNVAFTTDPNGAPPATNYVESGYILNSQLEFICNDATWEKVVIFGDAQQALASMGLYPVIESITEPVSK